MGFGAGAYVTLVQRESYRRDVLVSGSSSRRRRSVASSSVMVRFRTTVNTGVLVVASRDSDQALLWVSVRIFHFLVKNHKPILYGTL